MWRNHLVSSPQGPECVYPKAPIVRKIKMAAGHCIHPQTTSSGLAHVRLRLIVAGGSLDDSLRRRSLSTQCWTTGSLSCFHPAAGCLSCLESESTLTTISWTLHSCPSHDSLQRTKAVGELGCGGKHTLCADLAHTAHRMPHSTSRMIHIT